MLGYRVISTGGPPALPSVTALTVAVNSIVMRCLPLVHVSALSPVWQRPPLDVLDCPSAAPNTGPHLKLFT
jgi:hypothetical protein